MLPCKPCLSKSRGALVFLVVFLFLYAVIYNYYYKHGDHDAYITEFEISHNALNATRLRTSNTSLSLSPSDCPFIPPSIVDASSLAKTLGLPPAKWMQTPIVNPFPYGYVHNPCTICASRSVEVFIGVPVSRKNFEERQTIRETWGDYVKDPDHRAVLLFFLGSKSENEPFHIQKEIDEESVSFADIVQADFVDSYRNLSMKSMSVLRWFDAYCPQADFLVKADDDMYIAVPRLLQRLKETSKEVKKGRKKLFLTGSQIVGAVPVQDKTSKWYTPKEQFAEKNYPVYASGTSYSMTGDTSRMLLQSALRTPLFWLEDIYITGLCSRKAGIPVIHDVTITYNKPSATGCKFRSFTTGHRYKMHEIRKIHKELYDKNLKCDG